MIPFGRKETEKTLAQLSSNSNIAGAFSKFTFSEMVQNCCFKDKWKPFFKHIHRAHRQIVVHVAESVGQALNLVGSQALRIIDDIIMRGCDGAAAGSLTHNKEVIPERAEGTDRHQLTLEGKEKSGI